MSEFPDRVDYMTNDELRLLKINYEKMLEFIKKSIAGSTCINNENLQFFIGDTVIDNAKELLKEMGMIDE